LAENGYPRLILNILAHWLALYNCLHGKAPLYLTDCCTPISDVPSRRHLRSASRRQLLVPRHNLSTYGRRAFSVAGPAAWNCLSDQLREPSLTEKKVSDSYLRLDCLLSTSAYSALEVLHIMRYTNLFTDSFTYSGEGIWDDLTQTILEVQIRQQTARRFRTQEV